MKSAKPVVSAYVALLQVLLS